jgi:hypothetical protein
MKQLINYNIQIFLTWIKFIVFKYPVTQEQLGLIEKYYSAKPREKKLIARIRKINNIS